MPHHIMHMLRSILAKGRHSFKFIAMAVMTTAITGCALSEEPTMDAKRTPADQAAPQVAPAAAPPAAMAAQVPARMVKIGLMLPLSGSNAPLGRALQDAAFLALNDKYAALSPELRNRLQIVLIPKDSGEDEASALQALQELSKHGAELILGPLFGNQLQAIKPLLQEKQLTAISFTNNRDMAGERAFLMSFLPDQQMARVLHHAQTQGIQSVAALLPNDAYGHTMGDLLYAEGAKLGMTLSGLAHYSKQSKNTQAELKQLFQLQQGKATADIQALVIPEGGERLNAIVRDMQQLGINPASVKILGSGQWDDPNFRLNPALAGSWYATADPARRAAFEQRFERSYRYKPARLASLAYDAMALAGTLVYSQPDQLPQQIFTPEALTLPAGFNGPADGIFRFRPDGTAERGLTVMEVTEQGAKPVSPAPEYFATAPATKP